MDANEEIGQPEYVYWPSEGGSYEKVTYALWKLHRLAGTIYRPVVVTVPKKSAGPRTAWDRLMSDAALRKRNPWAFVLHHYAGSWLKAGAA